MEHLSLQDSGAPNGPLAPPQQPPAAVPQGVPQLPPQMFTTAAQLLDLTDSEAHLVPTLTYTSAERISSLSYGLTMRAASGCVQRN